MVDGFIGKLYFWTISDDGYCIALVAGPDSMKCNYEIAEERCYEKIEGTLMSQKYKKDFEALLRPHRTIKFKFIWIRSNKDVQCTYWQDEVTCSSERTYVISTNMPCSRRYFYACEYPPTILKETTTVTVWTTTTEKLMATADWNPSTTTDGKQKTTIDGKPNITTDGKQNITTDGKSSSTMDGKQSVTTGEKQNITRDGQQNVTTKGKRKTTMDGKHKKTTTNGTMFDMAPTKPDPSILDATDSNFIIIAAFTVVGISILIIIVLGGYILISNKKSAKDSASTMTVKLVVERKSKK